MTVLDLSGYDLPTLDAPCMNANGVTGAILGVFSENNPPGPMGDAAQSLRDAGIDILGFYGLIYFGSPYGVTRDTKWAIQLAKRFGVERVWLDCEIDGKAIGFTDAVTPTPASRVNEIRECVKLVEDAGLKCGIYSGSWWWPGNTGNTTEFSRLPLWHAGYLNDGSAIKTVNYGGWTDVSIHQYTSSLNVCGRNRDANYVFMEEDDMTPAEREEHNALVAIMGGRDKLLANQALGNDFILGYSIEQQKLADHLHVGGRGHADRGGFAGGFAEVNETRASNFCFADVRISI